MTGRWKSRRATFAFAEGAAAVEFALILPLLLGLVIGIVQYSSQIVANQQLHNGVATAAMYVMRGGSGSTAIQNVALDAWPNKPADAAVSISMSCQCGSASASCTSLCADNSFPQGLTAITATGTYIGLFGNQAMSATQIVRTQ